MSASTRKFVVLATGSLLLLGALAVAADARGGHGGGHGGHGGHGHAGHRGGHAHHAAQHRGHVNHVNHGYRHNGWAGRGGYAPGWWGGYWGPNYTSGPTIYVPPTNVPRTIIVPNLNSPTPSQIQR